MHHAHEGQLVAASVQGDHTHLPPAQKEQDEGAEVITGILSGNVSLDQREISVLCAHLQSCSFRHVEPSLLTATLQAMQNLIHRNQAEVIASCGIPFWLANFAEDLVLGSDGRGESLGSRGESLGSVVQLLVQATSILLVSANTAGECV